MDTVIALLGGVALFLYGMMLMGSGLKAVAGSRLELILYRLCGTPFRGILLGTGVTAVIQSSSATSIMVVGFVNSGMMKVRQAIGVVLGAILGTSITGWIICLSDLGGNSSGWVRLLSTATLTGVVAVAGIILSMFCKKRVRRQLGEILMGFAILMTGMAAMSAAVEPLRDNPVFLSMLTTFSNPIIGILVGMGITCILQSSSATIGILQALSVTGVITFGVAFPIIMGIAIGAAVPVLLSALGAGVNGKRTAFVYLLIDLIGAVFWSAVFYTVNLFAHFPFLESTVGMVDIALINTVFRLATVLLLAPAIGGLEKIVARIFPESAEDREETADIDRLEERFLPHPTLALEQSRLAVCSMAEKSRKNLSRAFALLHCYTEEGYRKIQAKEEVIDRYEDKLGTYLVKLTGTELSHDQSREISKFLHTISDFERIGDHAVNLSETAREIHEKKLTFSDSANRELNILASAVAQIVVLTTDAFTQDDLSAARRVEPLEEVIDELCDEIKIRHVRRIQSGNCTLAHGFVFNDLLTNYERIADHCSNIAVAMIEIDMDQFDTHEYLHQIKDNHEESFNRTFRDFEKQYQLDADENLPG